MDDMREEVVEPVLATLRAGLSMDAVPVPEAIARLRRFALDGALLLFDRDTGLNVLCDGPETAHLRQLAPRVVQFGITNRCNLTCSFCSRDLAAASAWTADDAFGVLRGLAARGVLEVAFGGGEPWLFPRFDALLERLHGETPLAASVTTNGLALGPKRLRRLRGRYGQLRLSLYDDNDWRARVALLADEGARFGVNLLVDPTSLPRLEDTVIDVVAAGGRDVLLLSYNGADRARHLPLAAIPELERRVGALARGLQGQAVIKLDVCWGSRLAGVPRLLPRGDCGAGRDFVVITSDRRVMPCSFHTTALPFCDADDVLELWSRARGQLAAASPIPGCARTPGFGLSPSSDLVALRRS
jgi:MoaA/NifB/PqqE/SkfB family radical SAM enzyme